VGLHTRLLCEESGETVEEDTDVYELKCNITMDVNHLSEGIRLGLQGDREKNSEALGRLALFKVCVLAHFTCLGEFKELTMEASCIQPFHSKISV
jgi:hypothetical protein